MIYLYIIILINFTDMLTFCITIHDNGNLLEICVPSDSHGSHVANIAAAYFPNVSLLMNLDCSCLSGRRNHVF